MKTKRIVTYAMLAGAFALTAKFVDHQMTPSHEHHKAFGETLAVKGPPVVVKKSPD